jgi:hypothetical protein
MSVADSTEGDVCPSEGCVTVRAVWKARVVLNPAGTGVTGDRRGSWTRDSDQ